MYVMNKYIYIDIQYICKMKNDLTLAVEGFCWCTHGRLCKQYNDRQQRCPIGRRVAVENHIHVLTYGTSNILLA